jgi:hypothetical protein
MRKKVEARRTIRMRRRLKKIIRGERKGGRRLNKVEMRRMKKKQK